MKSVTLSILLASGATGMGFSSMARAEDPVYRVAVEVDLSQDDGTGYGSLFEAVDADGVPIFGAGFLESYNTRSRNNRMKLSFYTRDPLGGRKATLEAFPRINDTDAGYYIYDHDGTLVVKADYTNESPDYYAWDAEQRHWRAVEIHDPRATHVAGGRLEASDRTILFNGNPVFTLGEDQGVIHQYYYANGWLCFKRAYSTDSPQKSTLCAVAWLPGDSGVRTLEDARQITLSHNNEFSYSYGHIGGNVIACTNMGGMYLLKGGEWHALRVWDNTSYQVYSTVRWGDRLLLGHYPSGHLYELAGMELRELKDWPPRDSRVSPHAREAQTLGIYAGQLFAGVWPWAEVSSYDPATDRWSAVGRMFSHPEPHNDYNHPYEQEAREAEIVYNYLGQRVTGLVPHGDSLIITTSSKQGRPIDEKFSFLDSDKAKDYGRIYRYYLPGQLAVYMQWPEGGRTLLEFLIYRDRIVVRQDGAELGHAVIEPEVVKRLTPQSTIWGKGVFGPFTRKIVNTGTSY